MYDLLMTALFMTTLIAVVVWAGRLFVRSRPRGGRRRAREVLDRRFAAGLITPDEYGWARRALDRQS